MQPETDGKAEVKLLVIELGWMFLPQIEGVPISNHVVRIMPAAVGTWLGYKGWCLGCIPRQPKDKWYGGLALFFSDLPRPQARAFRFPVIAFPVSARPSSRGEAFFSKFPWGFSYAPFRA